MFNLADCHVRFRVPQPQTPSPTVSGRGESWHVQGCSGKCPSDGFWIHWGAMPHDATVHVEYSGSDERTRIWFDNGDSEELLVTVVGCDLYRVEETSLFGDANYGDVIRASRRSDGGLLLLGIESRSDLVTQSWILSKDVLDSPECDLLLKDIMADGGNWERAFGGVLLVHTSASSAVATAGRVKALTRAAQPPEPGEARSDKRP